MKSLRTAAVAIVSTVAIGTATLSVYSAAHADETVAVPCANQQAQADKASAKLDALTAKFAAHPTKRNQKAKKAQVQRVTRATARLDACLAGPAVEPTVPTEPTPPA